MGFTSKKKNLRRDLLCYKTDQKYYLRHSPRETNDGNNYTIINVGRRRRTFMYYDVTPSVDGPFSS